MAIPSTRIYRDNYYVCFSERRGRGHTGCIFAENRAALSDCWIQERSAAKLTCSYLEQRALSAGHAIEVHSSAIACRAMHFVLHHG